MKKSHPIRHRALAVRRAHRARTLAHRRQVEALAVLMGVRRALQERHFGRPALGRFGMIAEAFRSGATGFAAIVQRLRAGQAVEPGTLARLGVVRVPPGIREIAYQAAHSSMRRA